MRSTNSASIQFAPALHPTIHGGVERELTTGPIVLLRGYLKGMLRDAECNILARKVPVAARTTARSPDYTYSDCAVIDAPMDLPDGEYLIYFDHHTVAATKERGYWIPRGAAKRYREPIFMAS
jgi:hypothetical protein